MPVTYKNKGNKIYYLHHEKTKTGKPRYYFSMKDEGNLMEKIPEGYEIYEHPSNAQVFLRKKQSQVITDIENHLINKYLKNLKSSYRYISDIKGKVITIFESRQNRDNLKEILKMLPFREHRSDSYLNERLEHETSYGPILRFILEDEKQRIFIAERFCFKGSVDDWIFIGGPDSLENLLQSFLKHLGQDSFYDLY